MENHLQFNHEEHPDWPQPDATARHYSRKLGGLIVEKIKQNGGSIGFDQFMEMALYEPGLGYYSAGTRKFGDDGDFTTAPEISPLFSYCLARQCEQVFELTGVARVLELGAGSGTMACDILSDLQTRNSLPSEYLILETSAELKQRQYQTLSQNQPELLNRIEWLDTLPSDKFDGVVLANEVLDALPVHRVVISGGDIREMKVGNAEEGFGWTIDEQVDDLLLSEANARLGDIPAALDDSYQTEVSLLVKPLLRSLSDVLSNGAILIIDYGYPRREYYHPQRTGGTLVCHYRHRRHDNPFILVGCQDISCFVDFTAVAESAHDTGLEVHGYNTQAGYLISCGIDEVISTYRGGDEKWNLQLSQQAGQLMLPGGMGEIFKVMGLTRNISSTLLGFQSGNCVHRL